MRPLLALLLAALPAAAQPPQTPAAPTQTRRFVNAEVRGTFRDHWDIDDHGGRIWLRVSAFGNSLDFNGRPFSGNLWGSGDYYTLSGGSISGSVSKFGNGLDARINAYGPQGSRFLNFHVFVNGRLDDPRQPPHLSIHGMDASLNFSPSFNRGYTVSGTIDEQRFGDEGLAVACLLATIVLKDRPQSQSVPGRDFLKKSAAAAPLLRGGFAR